MYPVSERLVYYSWEIAKGKMLLAETTHIPVVNMSGNLLPVVIRFQTKASNQTHSTLSILVTHPMTDDCLGPETSVPLKFTSASFMASKSQSRPGTKALEHERIL